MLVELPAAAATAAAATTVAASAAATTVATAAAAAAVISTAATSVVATATTAAAGSLLSRSSFVHGESPSVEGFAVGRLDCCFHVVGIDIDESKASTFNDSGI